MTRQSSRAYTIIYAREVQQHLAAIERKYHRLIKEEIEEQLCREPEVETRNRKPLRQPAPFEAVWELRCGPNNRFRVFYEVTSDEHEVWILAIGVKEGSTLLVGGEEFEV